MKAIFGRIIYVVLLIFAASLVVFGNSEQLGVGNGLLMFLCIGGAVGWFINRVTDDSI